MVVELLTFRVEPADQAAWLRVDERVWTRFLEQQPGFVRKQVWISDDEPEVVRAVVWWRSMADWNAISPATVADVDARMGDWFRPATCEALRVHDG